MALSETAKLSITMALRDNTVKGRASITKGFKSLEKSFARSSKSLGQFRKNLGTGLKVGAGLAVGGLALLTHQISKGISALAEHEKLDKLTAAAIKSTGGAAHIGAKGIREMAEALEDKTTIDDKQIQASANLLLRFQKVRNEIGKGNHIYDRAVEAALDMHAAGKDLDGAMTALGKSLNDPVRGIAQLRRQGISFTAQEEKKIKTLMKSGRILEAQKVILDKVSRTYGGSAAAAAKGYEADQRRLQDAWEDAQKSLAKGFLPVLTTLSRKLTTVLKDPATQKRIEEFGNKLAGLFSDKNIDAGGKVLRDVFNELAKVPWSTVTDGLKLAGTVAREAFNIFNSMDPQMKKVIIGALALNTLTGGLVKSVVMDLAGIALKSLSTIMAGTVTVIGKTVNAGGGGGGAPVPVGGKVPAGGSLSLGKVIVASLGPAALAGMAVASDNRTVDLSDTSQFAITGRLSDLDRAIQTLTGKSDMNSQAVLTKLQAEKDALVAGNFTLANEIKLGSMGTSTHLANVNAAIARANASLVANRAAAATQLAAVQYAVKAGTGSIYGVIERKNMNPIVNVSVSTSVSVRDYARTTATRVRYGNVPI